MSFRALLAREFALQPSQLDRLQRHYDLLRQWNKKMNLIRVESSQDAVTRHYCESILLALALPPGSLAIADVGSGAGFPGIPAAMVRPDCHFTLIESNHRKAVFLSESTRGFSNVQVVSERLESIESRFDWAISRAVNPVAVLSSTIATHFALLTTKGELSRLPPAISVSKLPWADDRVLAMFHVEHARIDQQNSREQGNRGNKPKGRGRKDNHGNQSSRFDCGE